MGYDSDRAFTDKVHEGLAKDKIYSVLGWTQANYSMLEHVDVQRGIDYMLIEQNGELLVHTVQERFRESKYASYGDFTLRYTRMQNQHENRRLSEFFKIEAEYMVYGIINQMKSEVDKADDFIKFAVIDMNRFLEKVDAGLIYVDVNHRSNSSIIDGRLVGGYNENRDRSSEFVAFNIDQLIRLFGEEMVLLQKGFV